MSKSKILNHQPEPKGNIRRATALSILLSVKVQEPTNSNCNILKLTNVINNRITELVGNGSHINANLIHRLAVLSGLGFDRISSPFPGKLMYVYNISGHSLNDLDRPLKVSVNRNAQINSYRDNYAEALEILNNNLKSFEI